MRKRNVLILCLLCAAGFMVGCPAAEGPIKPPPPVPAAYADRHLPEGWWTDPTIIEEGKAIYEGKKSKDVNCANCHGTDGKPRKRGTRDFRMPERMKLFSDSHLFWRVSEGVPKTKMKAWKAKLSEEDRWKAIAYLHRFSHGGTPVPHEDYTPTPPAEAKTGG